MDAKALNNGATDTCWTQLEWNAAKQPALSEALCANCRPQLIIQCKDGTSPVVSQGLFDTLSNAKQPKVLIAHFIASQVNTPYTVHNYREHQHTDRRDKQTERGVCKQLM